MDLPDFFYQFYTKGKRMEQLASTLFDVFKYICGLTLLKYLHKMSLCVCCDGGAICWSGCRRGDMIVLWGFAQITRGFEYQTDWFLHTGGGLQPTDGRRWRWVTLQRGFIWAQLILIWYWSELYLCTTISITHYTRLCLALLCVLCCQWSSLFRSSY